MSRAGTPVDDVNERKALATDSEVLARDPGEALTLGPADWRTFVSALNSPPAPSIRLKNLMAKTPPWECEAGN
jgi:uncharacterized protein (DUF1778 family)